MTDKNSPINLAVVFLSSPKEGYELLLDENLAGLSPLKRLLLTLQRAGAKEILITYLELDGFKLNSLKNDYASDTRFNCRLHWQDAKEISKLSNIDLTHSQPFILINGNIVTQEKLIETFVETVIKGSAAIHSVHELHKAPESTGGLYLLPPEKFSVLEKYTPQGMVDEKTQQVTISNPDLFLWELDSFSDLKKVEKLLLRQFRKHHTQFMDKWFNSVLSLKISSFLVKTPVTPNQLTLFGLVIGFASGWFFSQGGYGNGVIGGILLAITTIWDCCDGDVARLKFMESDFGDTLDTWCDNLINLFAFAGIMLGVSQSQGNAHALIPFLLLVLGGIFILILIYYPKGGKGEFFKGTKIYEVINVLASRNFIYIILLFALMGRLDIFLWLAGFGSIAFALTLYLVKLKISGLDSFLKS